MSSGPLRQLFGIKSLIIRREGAMVESEDPALGKVGLVESECVISFIIAQGDIFESVPE